MTGGNHSPGGGNEVQDEEGLKQATNACGANKVLVLRRGAVQQRPGREARYCQPKQHTKATAPVARAKDKKLVLPQQRSTSRSPQLFLGGLLLLL